MSDKYGFLNVEYNNQYDSQPEKPMEPFDVIYLDMDGVLVDLVGGLHKHFGLPDYPRSTAWEQELLPEGWQREMENSPESFWSSLEAFPWAHDLAHASREVAERVVLLTVPCGPYSAEGKAAWAQAFGLEVEFCTGFQNKGEWARGNRTLLIDDKEENCRLFTAQGGQSLLWPAEHNFRRTMVAHGIPGIIDGIRKMGTGYCVGEFLYPHTQQHITYEDTSPSAPSFLDQAAPAWSKQDPPIDFWPAFVRRGLLDRDAADVSLFPAQAHAPVPAPADPRVEVLQEALSIVTKDRAQAYGAPEDNFRNIAEIWTPILRQMGWEGPILLPHQVAILMEAMKIARKIQNPTHKDSWVDTAGYAACGYRCAMTEET